MTEPGGEDNDEAPALSGDALAALQEFYNERDTRQKTFEDLKSKAEAQFEAETLSMEAFAEDWNASQFWYDDETATLLARQLLEGATSESCIAVVSAPSVFVQLKNLLATGKYACSSVTLLEFDTRFEVFPEFVPYDFQQPLRLPGDLKGKFDRIICDPPFLSADCQTKAALTVRWLARPSPAAPVSSPAAAVKVIVCTGERMGSLVDKLYGPLGARTTTFEPRHAKGLSNEFRCYANFEGEAWAWATRAA